VLVRRGGAAPMFHTTRTATRASIDAHGLDWNRMFTLGIAGSPVPEWPGIFLSADLESARWFAGMPHGETADVWRVDVEGTWLEGAPDDDQGGGDSWMIAPVPIPRSRLRLVLTDLGPGREPDGGR